MSTRRPARRLVIRAKAPTRVDLAGGTVDIWPLFLMIPDVQTINVGIDLYAEATLEVEPGATVTLRSEDQGAELTFEWSELERVRVPSGLKIHQRLLAFYAPQIRAAKKSAIVLRTKAKSPAGAGLGGSSALNIALTGVLSAWAKHKKPQESLIRVSRDIETGILGSPAGLQDYYGAMFGGLQAIHWGVGGHCRASFSDKVRKGFEKRLLLFYSGQSRNSGINNWALFKGFLDGNPEIQKKFELISLATRDLGVALEAADWRSVGVAIDKEWQVRRTLAQGISTPAIDRAMDSARRLGATAGKVCGAGGGGCFFVYVPDDQPSLRQAIVRELESQDGVKHLAVKTVSEGLGISKKNG